MRIDRQKAIDAFVTYTSHYDSSDEKVKLKIDHTCRVADLCEQIARAQALSQEDVDLAWLSGMLHDVGRFEQLRQYGTFLDADSIDHAVFGTKLLFDKNNQEGHLIRSFVEDDREDDLLTMAVWCHSAYRIPENLDERTEMFCHILRDADKIDILKVNVDVPMETIYNVATSELRNARISPEVMEAFEEEHAILRRLTRTSVDHVVSHLALVFELVFPISIEIVQEQQCLRKLLEFESDNRQTRQQFAKMKQHMMKYINAIS